MNERDIEKHQAQTGLIASVVIILSAFWAQLPHLKIPQK